MQPTPASLRDHRERGNPTRSVVASRRRSNLFSRDSFGSLGMTLRVRLRRSLRSLAMTREWGFPGNDTRCCDLQRYV